MFLLGLLKEMQIYASNPIVPYLYLYHLDVTVIVEL